MEHNKMPVTTLKLEQSTEDYIFPHGGGETKAGTVFDHFDLRNTSNSNPPRYLYTGQFLLETFKNVPSIAQKIADIAPAPTDHGRLVYRYLGSGIVFEAVSSLPPKSYCPGIIGNILSLPKEYNNTLREWWLQLVNNTIKGECGYSNTNSGWLMQEKKPQSTEARIDAYHLPNNSANNKTDYIGILTFAYEPIKKYIEYIEKAEPRLAAPNLIEHEYISSSVVFGARTLATIWDKFPNKTVDSIEHFGDTNAIYARGGIPYIGNVDITNDVTQ